MRFHFLVAGLIGWLLASPALADVTVRYSPGPEGRRGLVIEADENGRVRAEDGQGQVMIIRYGVAYLIQPGENGQTVSRFEDFLAVAMEAFSGLLGPNILSAVPRGYTLNDRGPESVGRWRGTLYSIEAVGGATPPVDGAALTINGESGLELVVSNDPGLAQVGASGPVFETLFRLMSLTFGAEPPALFDHARDVLRRGAVLRMGRDFVLEGFSAGPVAAARFELPGPVLDREALRAQMNRAMQARGQQ